MARSGRGLRVGAGLWPPDLPLSRHDWEEAHEQGYRYCAIVEDGEIAALGAVWRYSEDRWEVAAVGTKPNLRRRGYAKRIVSLAVAHILACGRIATCTTERGNIAMIRAAESVGFKRA